MIKLPPFDKNLGRNIKVIDFPGHKPTHASVLLLWYSKPTSDVKNVVELGSGTGFVTFGLKILYNLKVTGIEKEKELVEAANAGIKMNRLNNINFLNEDVKNIKKRMLPEQFDMVIFNPPYHLGPASNNYLRKTARTANKETLKNFVETASYLLRNRGTFVTIIAPYRLPDYFQTLQKFKLIPQQMCIAYGKKAELVLIRGRKNGGAHLEIDQPVFL
ncbi:methyltransferase domain-containing protein [Thermosipho ferrireducens]|uniref:Methyltransferase domain-containing protein n=1 Tax=Thermosipho ferrireducens TaxID=2571116 RepID=A0ABX7S6J9_9BACT|nr:methyltransferase domain-containing protein [Thermosipho ferrireducens]QTA38194.1 methyltransferase domain-containing protein [Thermosipho ferrireducens]